MKATVCLVPFTDTKRFFNILRQVRKATGPMFEIIVVDNGPGGEIKKKLHREKYILNRNKGKLAGAINRAVEIAKGEYFIYLCAVHTRIYSDDWLSYMVSQMDSLSKLYVMGGDLRPWGSLKHVQGGIFIARTEWLRENPYDEKRHPFTFMDVYISKEILRQRKRLWRLARIHSSMRGWSIKNHVQNTTKKKFKIVHAHETYNYA